MTLSPSDELPVNRLTHASRSSRSSSLLVCAAAPLGIALTLVAGGCDFLNAGDGGVVNVYATHQGTPVDGEFPVQSDGQIIVELDSGWTVFVDAAYLTTRGAFLTSCDGEAHDVDMYFGSLPEHLNRGLPEPLGVGAVGLPPGSYCSATVYYGPFVEDTVEGGFQMPEPRAIGTTIWMNGTAIRGEESVPFEIAESFDQGALVEFEAPMTIKDDATIARQVTLWKTYDRFFDGVDFTDYETIDWNQRMRDVLLEQSFISEGTSVSPQD